MQLRKVRKGLKCRFASIGKGDGRGRQVDKGSITEVKNYSTPPDAVVMVLSACMILFKKPTDWKTAKLKISESNFLQQVKEYDKDNIPKSILSKIRKYCKKPEFDPEDVKKNLLLLRHFVFGSELWKHMQQ